MTHTFIGPFLELLVVACLLQEVQNGNGELGIRQRVGLWVYTTLCSRLQQQQSVERRYLVKKILHAS